MHTSTGTQIEIRRRSRVLEAFDSALDVDDVDGLTSLLRRRAKELRADVADLELRAQQGKTRRTVRV